MSTYIAFDEKSASSFSFIDIQDVEREAQELIIGEITKSIASGGKSALQGAATPVGTPSADISVNITETFKKDFRQRFMARTVSIDGEKKYFRVTQRGTQEHPVEGLKRYVVTVAIKPQLFKDALFTPVFIDPVQLKGVRREYLYVPERLRADGLAVTVAVVRRVIGGDETRVEFDDNVQGLVVLKQQNISGIWRYPLTLYNVQITGEGCWDVANVVPILQSKRSTGEIDTVTFASETEARALIKFFLSNWPASGDPLRLKEIDHEGKETGAMYDLGFVEGSGQVSLRHIPRGHESRCLASIRPVIHRATPID